jgi:hypothetical protein
VAWVLPSRKPQLSAIASIVENSNLASRLAATRSGAGGGIPSARDLSVAQHM